MPSYSIRCRDCNVPYEATRSDAKTCPHDRLLRVLSYPAAKWKRPRKCAVCSSAFRPVTAKDLSVCGKCRPQPNRTTACAIHYAKGDHYGKTSYSAGEGPMLAKGVPVCLHCATDPTKQAVLLKSLRESQVVRRKLHMTPTNPEAYPA